jgi:HSP20 family protein
MRTALEFPQILSPFNELSLVRDLVQPLTRTGFCPTCDIEETDAEYRVTFDIPGVAKEDVKIELENDELRIRGERRSERAAEGGAKSRFHFSERAHGKFQRVFTLPAAVDAEAVKARFENGVLSVTLPKAAVAKARSIQIEG